MKPGDLVKVQMTPTNSGRVKTAFGIIISEHMSPIGRDWIVKITGVDGLTICSPIDMEVISESKLR